MLVKITIRLNTTNCSVLAAMALAGYLNLLLPVDKIFLSGKIQTYLFRLPSGLSQDIRILSYVHKYDDVFIFEFWPSTSEVSEMIVMPLRFFSVECFQSSNDFYLSLKVEKRFGIWIDWNLVCLIHAWRSISLKICKRSTFHTA